MEPGPHLDLLMEALEVEGAAQRALLAGDEAGGRDGMRRAAERYRASWEAAPPASYGRLVGMLKAAVIAGGGRAEADYAAPALAGAPGGSPTASYARAIAALVAGDDAAAAAAAAGMRGGDAAFGRAADAIAALAGRDPGAYAEALGAIVADFEGRDTHLTGVSIADTALMLETLADARGMARRPLSPLLPAGAPPAGHLHPSTVAVVTGRGARTAGAALSVPVSLASTYLSGGEGPAYGRDGNPSWSALEEAVGALEGGDALAFASGMAATAAVFDGLPAGAVVVAPARGYHGLRRLLGDAAARGHLTLRLADLSDTPGTLALCAGADLLWAESPTNPLLEIADLEALAAGAHAAGARMAVDNTLATPLLQRPLDLGADVVVHSATKLLSGHSDLVMGAAVTRDPDLAAGLLARRSLGGAVPGPLEAFLALRGVRTLPLRLERAQATAGELARRLAAHPAVALVRYPGLPEAAGHDLAARQMRGFGTLLAVEVPGGAEAADAVCARVRLIVTATSLGGVETMMERRARWPGEELTPPGLLRLSVGLEHVEDLWEDLDAALRAAV